MVEDDFEIEIAGLFDQAQPFADDAHFADAVAARVAKIRRTGRLLHTTAFVAGGAIALYELAQPELWQAIGGWAARLAKTTAATLSAPAPAWLTPTPMLVAAVLGTALLVAYIATVWREA